MRTLKKVIASRQAELRNHRLFRLIESSRSAEPLATMARALAWWPMVFQDVLRLNMDRIQGSEFERFAQFHRDEDSGHDRWFLEDLRAFSVQEPGLDELFDGDFQPIRDACYALVAEIYRNQSGAQRVALLLALEPTGHVFFEQISAAVDRLCPELPLRYFARSHLGVEKDHDLFKESTDADLDRIVLTDRERAESEQAVARIYRTFANVFSYLADRIEKGARSASHVRELGGAEASDPSVRHARGT
jgi:hypothetical protein